MPSQVAHDAVGYGIKIGANALEYGKSRPVLRGLVELWEKPARAVISSKVCCPCHVSYVVPQAVSRL